MMITILNIFFGILLILAGVFIPYSIYKIFQERIRYRILLLSMAVEFGMIAASIGFFLIVSI
ncbi:MAG: hypothetical protein RIC06_05585 [Cyclobacteriaceae bacterium]